MIFAYVQVENCVNFPLSPFHRLPLEGSSLWIEHENISSSVGMWVRL